MSDDKEKFEELEDSSGVETKNNAPSKSKKSTDGKNSKIDSKSDAKKKKTTKKNPVVRWFREMRAELKKVVWLTPKQTLNNTIVAFVMMISAGIVIWGIDQVASTIFNGIRTALRFGG